MSTIIGLIFWFGMYFYIRQKIITDNKKEYKNLSIWKKIELFAIAPLTIWFVLEESIKSKDKRKIIRRLSRK